MSYSAVGFILRLPGLARLCFGLAIATSVVPACSCIPQGVKQDMAAANVVFRGVVSKVKELPERREGGRRRYAVTFSVSRYWKGNPEKVITIRIVQPGTDCIGAHFDERKEYVVFAISQGARDYWLEGKFWYGWLDMLPRGTQFLTVNNFCDSTAEVKQAGKTLRALGKGKTLSS
jgi:hypothetical protein